MLEATARAEEDHFWFRGLRRNAGRLLEAALAGRRPRRIIDCGAGTGRNLEWLGQFGPAVGVELSPTGLAHARAAGRTVVQATVTALPFPDAIADVATSFDVLYCLDDANERLALEEMWRVLRPAGIVLVNVAALDVLRGSHSTLTMEVRRYSRARLRAVLEAAGFTVERMTFTNGVTFPVTLAVRSLERMTGRAAEASDADLRVPPAPVNAVFNAALAAEGALLRYVNLPIGSSLMAIGRKRAFPIALPP
jgi:SAM-dependent methyltransferase